MGRGHTLTISLIQRPSRQHADSFTHQSPPLIGWADPVPDLNRACCIRRPFESDQSHADIFFPENDQPLSEPLMLRWICALHLFYFHVPSADHIFIDHVVRNDKTKCALQCRQIIQAKFKWMLIQRLQNQAGRFNPLHTDHAYSPNTNRSLRDSRLMLWRMASAKTCPTESTVSLGCIFSGGI